MTKSSCLAIAAMIGALIGTDAAMAEETTFSHPADPVSPQGASASNAFDLAVPMLNRTDAYPSYGPSPAGAAADPVEEMDQMMEMDHSQHQMPGMDHSEMPGMDHSQHQMPGMNPDIPPENPE